MKKLRVLVYTDLNCRKLRLTRAYMNNYTFIRKDFENRLSSFRENVVLKTKSKIRVPSEFCLITASLVIKLSKIGKFWKEIKLFSYEFLNLVEIALNFAVHFH